MGMTGMHHHTQLFCFHFEWLLTTYTVEIHSLSHSVLWWFRHCTLLHHRTDSRSGCGGIYQGGSWIFGVNLGPRILRFKLVCSLLPNRGRPVLLPVLTAVPCLWPEDVQPCFICTTRD
jgi:hypothetical protein